MEYRKNFLKLNLLNGNRTSENRTSQLNGDTEVYSDVKLQLSVMKPIHVRWLIALYDYLRNQSVLTKKGFEKADIDNAVELDLEREDPMQIFYDKNLITQIYNSH